MVNFHPPQNEHYREPDDSYHFPPPGMGAEKFPRVPLLPPRPPLPEVKILSADKILEFPGREERPHNVRLYA